MARDPFWPEGSGRFETFSRSKGTRPGCPGRISTMASSADISAVARVMKGVPRHVIESRIDSGAIDPGNYHEDQED